MAVRRPSNPTAGATDVSGLRATVADLETTVSRTKVLAGAVALAFTIVAAVLSFFGLTEWLPDRVEREVTKALLSGAPGQILSELQALREEALSHADKIREVADVAYRPWNIQLVQSRCSDSTIETCLNSDQLLWVADRDAAGQEDLSIATSAAGLVMLRGSVLLNVGRIPASDLGSTHFIVRLGVDARPARVYQLPMFCGNPADNVFWVCEAKIEPNGNVFVNLNKHPSSDRFASWYSLDSIVFMSALADDTI